MKYYQHGDVLVKKIGSLPEGLKKLSTNVLMDGEATGHKHVVAQGEYELNEKSGTLYLTAKGDVIIKHDEHKPITIPEGNYVIGQVREYDFFADEIRQVRD